MVWWDGQGMQWGGQGVQVWQKEPLAGSPAKGCVVVTLVRSWGGLRQIHALLLLLVNIS